MSASPRPNYTAASLLDVAVRVFNERGYDGTSMGDLAAALGITKSSIYHHVAGKDALLGLALDRALSALFAVLDEPASTTGRARDRLEHVVRRSVAVLDAELPFVTLLLRVRGNTPTEQDALERRREFDRRVAELVAQAVDDGDLRADLDPSLVTRLLFGTVNSLVEWYRPGRGASADEVADALVEMTLRGLER
ncbi:TetR/AcrR family transcriptional regulator [Egicoccus sp. AB-alg6-2]|uniref:TetR/AcrR family transcriptional regulator n=1 Tax=Egicoccus sp. AB-alg6-2 TaxID=3242692 RepID=UPI00359D2719